MNRSNDSIEIMHELLKVTVIGRDMQPLTNLLSQILQGPIVIADQLSNPISQALIPDLQSLIIEQCETGSMDEMNTCPCTLITAIGPVTSTACQISHFGELLGYFIMPEPNQLNHDPLVKYATTLYASILKKREEAQAEKIQLREVFLFNLLYGNVKDRQDIMDYGLLWGWDFSLAHTVVVFSNQAYNPFTTNTQWANNTIAFIEECLAAMKVTPILLHKQHEVILILPCQNIEQEAVTPIPIIDLIASSEVFIQASGKIATGIGKTYSDPTELFRSYQEAKVALELGMMLGMATPSFASLGLERILYHHDVQELREYYSLVLGDLIRYDADNRGNLVETLEKLSIHQFDISKTAQSLFLHPNSLRYRLKKIEDILGVSLDEMRVKLDITAALTIKQLGKI